MKINEVGPNKFSFSFSDPAHKVRVLKQAPWNIRGFLLFLREWSPTEAISDLDFTKAAYWIQIHGFPLARLSSINARLIGSKLGELIEEDTAVVDI